MIIQTHLTDKSKVKTEYTLELNYRRMYKLVVRFVVQELSFNKMPCCLVVMQNQTYHTLLQQKTLQQ
jgi:hypothetical protein